ncbi:MAG TPA: MEDS domain-containing protein [Mycobacteriales bacterium]|nr:MEDS domain-containing protein [Mycobacteriales bacterium]
MKRKGSREPGVGVMSVGAVRLLPEDDERHSVAFYRRDEDLLALADKRFAAAVRRGAAVIAIATPSHLEAFRSTLPVSGSALEKDQLLCLDAQATLDSFMVGDLPDPDAFDRNVASAVRSALRSHGDVCAFGEMVALLWQAGNREGALALERLWEGLLASHPFTLLCAYPSHLMLAEHAPEGVSEVCAVHSSVVLGPPVAADAETARHFAGHPGAPLAARQYVRDTLRAWGLSDLSDDAILVASELATNAVRHGECDFSVSIARGPGGVRLAVGDTDPRVPEPGDASTAAEHGRGLRIVDATARQWGHRTSGSGKLVWAELGGDDGSDAQ